MENKSNWLRYLESVPLPVLVALIGVIAVIVFVPASVAHTLAIDSFRTEYRIFLGPILLLCIAFLIARSCLLFEKAFRRNKAKKGRIKTLHNLTVQEKQYLAEFILDR